MLRQVSLAELRDGYDLLETIVSDLGVEPSGAGNKRYKILCPFHEEKTPSFVIDSRIQHWICFGCGKRGDVFDYLTTRRNCSLSALLRELIGDSARLKLPEPKPLTRDETEWLEAALGVAKTWKQMLAIQQDKDRRRAAATGPDKDQLRDQAVRHWRILNRRQKELLPVLEASLGKLENCLERPKSIKHLVLFQDLLSPEIKPFLDGDGNFRRQLIFSMINH